VWMSCSPTILTTLAAIAILRDLPHRYYCFLCSVGKFYILLPLVLHIIIIIIILVPSFQRRGSLIARIRYHSCPYLARPTVYVVNGLFGRVHTINAVRNMK